MSLDEQAVDSRFLGLDPENPQVRRWAEGEVIRRKRAARRLTVARLASRCGTTISALRRMEKGQQAVDPGVQLALQTELETHAALWELLVCRASTDLAKTAEMHACAVCGRPFCRPAFTTDQKTCRPGCQRILQLTHRLKAEIRHVHGPDVHYVLHVEVMDVQVSEEMESDPVTVAPLVVPVTIGLPLRQAIKLVILTTLDHCRGHITNAATLLGVSRRHVQNKLNDWGLRDHYGLGFGKQR